ncbi:SRPBCC family protein [Rhizobium sp. FKL33]|jgi:hypothetical protein|uniref:SRPBCC family protein n=1 Tax=Rhizobium sp. FKL33 TaxID=2562307 RepID=UPI0010C04536|nr:SRPBCC family protein [Rhizobium sp. FKL33]
MKISTDLELGASPLKAWNIFKTFSKIHAWHPATENTVLLVGKDGEPLAVREFQIKGGGFVISELLDYSETEMWFTYRIIKTDLPLKHYVGEMRVTDNGKGGSIVHWEGEFEHPKGSEATAEENDQTFGLVQAVFQGGLENIERLATA